MYFGPWLLIAVYTKRNNLKWTRLTRGSQWNLNNADEMWSNASRIQKINRAVGLNTFLWTFALIVSAHPYYTIKFTRQVMHESTHQVMKWTMIGQMAITITLPGFNDLRRLVTPIFPLLDHFIYRFSTFRENMKKICRLEVWSLAKCTIKFRSF